MDIRVRTLKDILAPWPDEPPIGGVSVDAVNSVSFSAMARVRGSEDNDSPGFKARMELLHRYNIFSMRCRLLDLAYSGMEMRDTETPEHVNQEIERYSQAIRNYRLFREEETDFFASFNTSHRILGYMKQLRSMKAAGAADSEILLQQAKIDDLLIQAVQSTTSGITVGDERKKKTALISRLFMAIGGGLALVGPMLIMVLHPTKLTAILTTSFCVVATAIALAILMVDSTPKDIVACTAAYAAVFVVFVGVGGGTS